jgi:hypothetical protein
MQNAKAIHFNLNGVNVRRVWLEAGELSGPLSARSKGLVTEWELRQIIGDRNLLDKATFFINGRSVDEEKVSGCAGIKPVWDRE